MNGGGATGSPIDNLQSTIDNPPLRAAVIDVGTNTVRLLVAESDGRSAHRTLLTAQEITRLGQGLLPARELQPEPIRRTLRVLRRYRELAETEGAATILAVGTSALREAGNRAAFLAAARDEAGVEVAVIAGEEEARLALLGVRAGLPGAAARLVMMDIGGGSTELLLADGEKILAMVSTGLGAVKLTESCLHGDPPLPTELETVRRTAAERLDRLLRDGASRPQALRRLRGDRRDGDEPCRRRPRPCAVRPGPCQRTPTDSGAGLGSCSTGWPPSRSPIGGRCRDSSRRGRTSSSPGGVVCLAAMDALGVRTHGQRWRAAGGDPDGSTAAQPRAKRPPNYSPSARLLKQIQMPGGVTRPCRMGTRGRGTHRRRGPGVLEVRLRKCRGAGASTAGWSPQMGLFQPTGA